MPLQGASSRKGEVARAYIEKARPALRQGTARDAEKACNDDGLPYLRRGSAQRCDSEAHANAQMQAGGAPGDSSAELGGMTPACMLLGGMTPEHVRRCDASSQ